MALFRLPYHSGAREVPDRIPEEHDAEPKRGAAAAIEALVRQVAAPVHWDAVVRRLASEGVRTDVEVGPGTVLAGLVRKIDREAAVASVEDEAGLAEVEALLAGGAS